MAIDLYEYERVTKRKVNNTTGESGIDVLTTLQEALERLTELEDMIEAKAIIERPDFVNPDYTPHYGKQETTVSALWAKAQKKGGSK